MNLEYLYYNNNNIKHAIKMISLYGLVIIVLFLLVIILEQYNTADYSLVLTVVLAIVIQVVFLSILCSFFILFKNIQKRKQFVYIKNNGRRYEGVVILALLERKGKYRYLHKNSGVITVRANNKTYEVSGIDYNDAFKNLKQKLNDIFIINRQMYIDLNESIKSEGKFYEVDKKELKIELYVLDDKAVADLESLT